MHISPQQLIVIQFQPRDRLLDPQSSTINYDHYTCTFIVIKQVHNVCTCEITINTLHYMYMYIVVELCDIYMYTYMYM